MIYTITLNPALDKTLIVDNLNINQIGRVRRTLTQAGGKGFNVSRALLRAGIHSKAIGLVGGRTGEVLLEDLAKDGIDVVPITINGETRVNQVFMENASKSVKINDLGPVISGDEFQVLTRSVDKVASPGDIWIMSGSLPPGVPSTVYAELTCIIQDRGGKVFLDSSGKAFQEGLNVTPDWIKPNLKEAREVFSGGLREVDLLEQFQQLGLNGTLLTMGARGLMFADNGMVAHVIVPKLKNENVVGAGDATVAGFIYGVVNELPSIDCAKWAAAFGVASAHASENCFQSFSDVETFYDQIKAEIINEYPSA